MDEDLREALAAINDVMATDKGLSEPEWSNRYPPLLQRHGYQLSTVDFGLAALIRRWFML